MAIPLTDAGAMTQCVALATVTDRLPADALITDYAVASGDGARDDHVALFTTDGRAGHHGAGGPEGRTSSSCGVRTRAGVSGASRLTGNGGARPVPPADPRPVEARAPGGGGTSSVRC